MYVMLHTRPNIFYALRIVTRYHSLGLDHWIAVKKILKYLRRIRDYIIAYRAKNYRKFIARSVLTFNGGSIRKGCIIDSTMDAEYVVACKAAKEAIWLRKFFRDFKVVPNLNLSITLYMNSGTVANSKIFEAQHC